MAWTAVCSSVSADGGQLQHVLVRMARGFINNEFPRLASHLNVGAQDVG